MNKEMPAMAEALDLTACPFCKKFGQETLNFIGRDFIGGWNVICHPCGAQGPLGKTADEAEALWNAITATCNDSLQVGELVEQLRTDLATIQDGDRALPWEVWDSCSFRRITSAAGRGGQDGGVLSGVVRSDGHPDLSMPGDQLKALCRIVNALPAILSALDRKRDVQEVETPKRGDKIKWTRSLEDRPLAVRDLEYVTVASWGLPGMPLVCTLQEVAGTFPMGWFDRTREPQAEVHYARLERLAFVREWFGWVPDDQITVEHNELQLDDHQSDIGNHSYLEQVHLWEVQPGEGEQMRKALLMLPDLLRELHDQEAAAYAATLTAPDTKL